MSDGKIDSVALYRFRAAAALVGLNVSCMARRCGVSGSHLRAVAARMRQPSVHLLEKIRSVLGEAGWAFWQGEIDALTQSGETAEQNGRLS